MISGYSLRITLGRIYHKQRTDFYIGETGRTLRERCGEHLRSINKIAPGFPVVEHFSSNGHTAADALIRFIKLCEGNKQRKRQDMRLIFRLGTCQPRGLNADFQFI